MRSRGLVGMSVSVLVSLAAAGAEAATVTLEPGSVTPLPRVNDQVRFEASVELEGRGGVEDPIRFSFVDPLGVLRLPRFLSVNLSLDRDSTDLLLFFFQSSGGVISPFEFVSFPPLSSQIDTSRIIVTFPDAETQFFEFFFIGTTDDRGRVTERTTFSFLANLQPGPELDPPAVPLPAAGGLLLAALSLLAVGRRRPAR